MEHSNTPSTYIAPDYGLYPSCVLCETTRLSFTDMRAHTLFLKVYIIIAVYHYYIISLYASILTVTLAPGLLTYIVTVAVVYIAEQVPVNRLPTVCVE